MSRKTKCRQIINMIEHSVVDWPIANGTIDNPSTPRQYTAVTLIAAAVWKLGQ